MKDKDFKVVYRISVPLKARDDEEAAMIADNLINITAFDPLLAKDRIEIDVDVFEYGDADF